MTRRTLATLLLGASLLAGCDMAPKYVRSVSNFVPPAWPQGAAYTPAQASAAGMPWRTLVTDAKLQAVVGQALSRNQDLAAAVANVASARAQYRVQRSSQLPTLAASAGASIQRNIGGGDTGSTANVTGGNTSDYTVFNGSLGVSSFELDLFGRLKNLSRQAFEQYLATQSGARSTRLSIVAETVSAYATYAADHDLLAIATAQVKSGERTVRLTQDLHDVGLNTGSDISDAITVLAQAKSDVAAYTTQVAQDRNALELLAGGPVADALLPTSLAALDPALGIPRAGLSSDVLLNRPDVVEAEHQLKGAVASIGAAKAAFFPKISLTSAIGVASTALSALFTGGASTFWSASPAISLPLLGGTNPGNLAYARAQADYYLATYRKTAQSAYRDVADGLARRGTIAAQRQAQRQLVVAAARSDLISTARYRAGTDSFLTALVAQRTLYAARQTEIATILADYSNRVTLYQAIGSDDTL